MAQVQTKQAAAPAGKRGRAKKGEEAFKLVFIGADDKEHNRVVTGVKAIKATDKTGKSKVITMDGLPDAVKTQLAFAGFRNFLNSPLKKDATDVIGTVDKTVKQLAEGTLFTKEGKKAGRVFDGSFWVSIFARAMEIAVEKKVPNAKKVSEEGKKKLLAQLEAATTQERNLKIKQWSGNPIFLRAKKEIELQRAEKNLANAGELAGLEF